MARHPREASSAMVGLLAVALLAFAACSGTVGGCSALLPIPSGRYQGPKTANAVSARLSADGISFLNQNWPKVLDLFAPNQTLVVPIACSTVNVTGFGNLIVADQGSASGAGLMDGRCDGLDLPVLVPVRFTGFSIAPATPNRLVGEATVEIATGGIFVSSVDRKPPACVVALGGVGCLFNPCPLRCFIDFDTRRANDPSNTVRATVAFTIDSRWGELLAFDFASIEGISPDPADVEIGGRSACGSIVCGLADFGPIKSFVLQQISPALQRALAAALHRQSCEPCGPALPPCPTAPDGTAGFCSSDGLCMDPAAPERCVPRFLGIEGRLAMGTLLSRFGVPAEAQLDVSIAAGATVSVDTGVNVGTVAGVRAVDAAACAPAQPPPELGPAPAPDFDGERPTSSDGTPRPYHLAISLSNALLSLGAYHAHQSGALCAAVSTSNIGLLHTGLFKTFLPSLGPLATRDGKDAPMMVVLRPSQLPQISIGAGSFDPQTRRPIDPLLTLAIPELTFDAYALIDDRFARLFSITADVRIPLSLAFENCSRVVPALGDLRQLISNFRVANSEMLAEDPAVLADLVPALVGLAEPALATALQGFELPQFAGFKLHVIEGGAKGLSILPGSQAYQHVGIYAELVDAAAPCANSAPVAQAALGESRAPEAAAMRLSGKRLAWPVAVLDVATLGAEAGTPEYAVRVDGGLWTTFMRPQQPGRVEVSHPAFLVQGRHAIDVRARVAEDPQGISAPVRVDFLVDWDAPEVSVSPDDAGALLVRARDAVTPPEALRFAYRFEDSPATEFGPAMPLALDEVERRGGVEVLVRDEAGNVASARWRVPTTATRPAPAVASLAASGEAAGCSTAGGGVLASIQLLVAIACCMGLLRRRR
ncbi:MAG TPA: hypothetical protein VE782_15160 [Myxococcaceae bacterium]|nr:hypothetical protein [Myxococcaceae bacterium]